MSNDADESMQHGTDHSLIQRLKAGQSSAATALYMRYAQQLRGLAMKQTSPGLASRIDPDDVVQSVFRTFFRRVVSDLTGAADDVTEAKRRGVTLRSQW